MTAGVRLEGLPMAPSVNLAWKNIPGRGRAKTRMYLDFESKMASWNVASALQIKAARALASKVGPGVGLRAEYSFYFDKDRILTKLATNPKSPVLKHKKIGESKKLDVGNFMKCAEDQVCKYLEIDDCYFWEVSLAKRISSADHEFIDISLSLIEHET